MVFPPILGTGTFYISLQDPRGLQNVGISFPTLPAHARARVMDQYAYILKHIKLIRSASTVLQAFDNMDLFDLFLLSSVLHKHMDGVSVTNDVERSNQMVSFIILTAISWLPPCLLTILNRQLFFLITIMRKSFAYSRKKQF